MKGIFTLKKVFPDGREEIIERDNNVLSINIARTFVNLFSNNLSPDSLEDLLVGYFQVGAGSHSIPTDPALKKYVYSLNQPFDESAYGPSATNSVVVHDQYFPEKQNFSPDAGVDVFKAAFVELSKDFYTKVTDDSVYFRLNIDEKTANGQTIQEFGLFSKNPDNFKVDRSGLIAYKTLDNAILKNELFSLVIDWQIKFIDKVEEINTQYATFGGASGEGYNVVVIMADDLGVDQLGIYNDHNPYDLSNAATAAISPFATGPQNADGTSHGAGVTDGSCIYPHTPALSAMAAGGITFFNARANALCTPTRANMLTGKCGFSSPAKSIRDEYGNEIYKGLWGHGIGTVSTENFQKLRGGLKGLGVTYPFLNSMDLEDNQNVFGISPGNLTQLNYSVVGGTTAQDPTTRRSWPSSWNHKEVPHSLDPYVHPGTDSGNIPANFTVLPDLLRNTDFVPSSYESGMVGKWHLGEWDDMYVYAERSSGNWQSAKGNGWKHIANIGKWDYVNAMFANLNKAPIPGHYNDIPNVSTGSPGWYAGIQDKDMGYVNYFQWNYSGLNDWETTSSLTTVSDTGYTTFKASVAAHGAGSPIAYEEGNFTNYATAKSFSDGVSMFNGMTEPFFLYLPLNAPHSPYTQPHSARYYTSAFEMKHAQRLYMDSDNTNPVSGVWANQNAQIENMDFELSAFLSSITAARKERTIFIFQGDNGSDGSMMERYATYASGPTDDAGATDLGIAGGRGGLGCGVGLGENYYKMLTAAEGGTGGADPLLTHGPPWDAEAGAVGALNPINKHQGGEGNTADFFKTSVYDRGVLIPYIVSANFLGDQAGTSSMAMIDAVDIYPTIAHIAGIDWDRMPKTQPYFTDGISFLPILRGEVDASTHLRQHSFFEVFRPNGASIGSTVKSGTYTGKIGKYKPNSEYPWTAPDYGLSSCTANAHDLAHCDDASGEGNNTIPYERRRGFIKRDTATTYGAEHYALADDAHGDSVAYGALPDASGGMYKLVRPSSGPKFDELYHLRDYAHHGIDQFEFVDMIPSGMKGQTTPIHKLLYDQADPTDNDDYFWKLLRIYTRLSRSLSEYLQYRTLLPGAVDSMYRLSPEAAQRVELPSVYDLDRLGEI